MKNLIKTIVGLALVGSLSACVVAQEPVYYREPVVVYRPYTPYYVYHWYPHYYGRPYEHRH